MNLARLHADGHLILAVGARDSSIPSETALRFGAWSAAKDAQVIAQWDYGTRHHYKRLSLQVRALAFSSRPASVLTPPSSSLTSDLEASSLVGEAKWMRRHWHPLTDGQPSFLNSLLDDQLVQISTNS